jgi:hypothetical protein
LGGVGAGVAGQVGPPVGRGNQRVHHGPADERVQQQRDRGVARDLAAADAAPHDGPGGEGLTAPQRLVELGHAGDGGGLQPEPQRERLVSPA